MSLILRHRNGYALPAGLRTRAYGSVLDSVLENILSPASEAAQESKVSSPRINIIENASAYELEAELPGVEKNEVKLTLNKQIITIEAKAHRTTEPKAGETIIHAESGTRHYVRSVELPQEIDDSQAVARMENGILFLSLPKKQATQSRTITIQ